MSADIAKIKDINVAIIFAKIFASFEKNSVNASTPTWALRANAKLPPKNDNQIKNTLASSSVKAACSPNMYLVITPHKTVNVINAITDAHNTSRILRKREFTCASLLSDFFALFIDAFLFDFL